MQKAAWENWHFRYGIAKFSQGLRNFHSGSENFAILSKISLCHIFTMIAKIRYHSENDCA